MDRQNPLKLNLLSCFTCNKNT